MLSPKMANFEKAKKEIEPYDDVNELRKQNFGSRLANLRMKIYKHGKSVAVDSPKKSSAAKSGSKGKLAKMIDEKNAQKKMMSAT